MTITPLSLLTLFSAIMCAHEAYAVRFTRPPKPYERMLGVHERQPSPVLTLLARASLTTIAIACILWTLQAWGVVP